VSFEYVDASSQLVGNLSRYNPNRKDDRGQFYAEAQPLLTNRTYQGSSFADAASNSARVYRDEKGVLRRLQVVEEPGVANTYTFAKGPSQASKGKSKLASFDKKKPQRAAAAQASTGSDVDLNQSGIKYQNINDKNKQSHHLLSVALHGGAFYTRGPDSREYILGELAKEGFFGGDDRRNLVAVQGNFSYNQAGERVANPFDEHQAGLHSKDSITSAFRQLMPSPEEFSQMSDDQVIETLKMSGLAARADIQEIKGVAQYAQASTHQKLQRQTAKAIASRLSNPKHRSVGVYAATAIPPV
jgi:hypothetical protein